MMNRLLFILLPLLLCLGAAKAVEDEAVEDEAVEYGFTVNDAETVLVDDVYHLDASIDYHFSPAVLKAIESGVPITVELEIEVYRQREWIWDEVRASLSQRYRIEYHALTQQYLVININSQVQTSYPTQQYAVSAMGVITDLPLLDRGLLEDGTDYMARLRVGLIVNELPSLMRPWAYLSSEWRLTSEWFAWRLQ